MPRIRTVEGSCWTCKERRVICDLTLPACEKCTKIDRQCDYGKVRLRWTDCVASRGRLAGKKIPLYHPPTFQRNQDTHILYFENELLPRFNLTNTVPSLDLKSLARDPVLIHSVIAVANAHEMYAHRTADGGAIVARIRDRNNALRLFRQNLSGAHNDAVNNSLFIANVLLCILDGIIEPSTETSATHHHLVGGKAILKHWGGVGDIFEKKQNGELPMLMLSIFATMDLTHALLMGDEPYFEASSWANFGGGETWWGNRPADDDYLETMAILSQLATLGYEMKTFQNTAPIGTLLSIQMDLEHQASRQVSGTNDDPDKASWAAFCSVYRFAASVYLYRALSSLDVDHPLVQQAVASCMEVVGGTALTKQLHHCILFPLLVVGTHCLSKQQQQLVRHSIVQTATYLSFESLRSLERFLEKRWASLEEDPDCIHSTWWEYFDEIAAATCLF